MPSLRPRRRTLGLFLLRPALVAVEESVSPAITTLVNAADPHTPSQAAVYLGSLQVYSRRRRRARNSPLATSTQVSTP
uniref:Secreted protein n=1 Tax=Setaria viridis TaxID=4556 RepID=A0A4U6U8D8_SETVI|nr:hypothetical protein SEVIR_6G120025v2 [Setaria viridis]